MNAWSWGLSAAEVAAYLQAAAGYDLGQAGAGMARALYQETDGNPFFVAEVLRHLAETGKLARGLTGVGRRASVCPTASGRWWAPGSAGYLDVGRSASELADDTAAATLYEQLAPWHDQVPDSDSIVFHCVAHSLGRLAAVLGRHDQAETHFIEALAIHQRLRAPFFIAETELAWGRLLTSCRPDRATPLLVDAAELATRYGYQRIQRLASEARP